MKTVEPDALVSLRFTMKSHLPGGTVTERPPETIDLLYGTDRQAKTLEDTLAGACVGDRLSATIPPAEIYGEHDPALVREIPRQGLIKQRLKKGRFYRQMKKGCLVSFRILDIRPDSVLADFNRPMAGISVEMDLEVLAIRQASDEEILAARESQLKKSIGCG